MLSSSFSLTWLTLLTIICMTSQHGYDSSDSDSDSSRSSDSSDSSGSSSTGAAPPKQKSLKRFPTPQVGPQFFADTSFLITQVLGKDADGRNLGRRSLEVSIEQAGGFISALLSKNVSFLIAGPSAFAKDGTQRVRKARLRGVALVKRDFVEACVAAKAIVDHAPYAWSKDDVDQAKARCAAAEAVSAAAVRAKEARAEEANAAESGSAAGPSLTRAERTAKMLREFEASSTTDLGCCCVCHEPGGAVWDGVQITPATCPWCAGKPCGGGEINTATTGTKRTRDESAGAASAEKAAEEAGVKKRRTVRASKSSRGRKGKKQRGKKRKKGRRGGRGHAKGGGAGGASAAPT